MVWIGKPMASDERPLPGGQMVIACFVLVAFDAIEADELRIAMQHEEVGSEDRSRIADRFEKMDRITVRDATPSAAQKKLQKIVAADPKWRGKMLEIRVMRETAKSPSDLWTADVTVKDEDEEEDTARMLRAIGRGDTESEAREEMLFMLRDLGWFGEIEDEFPFVSRPDSYLHCTACSGREDLKPMGGYGATYADALADARRLVKVTPEWKDVTPTFAISDFDRDAGSWEVALKVNLFAEHVLVTFHGRTKEDAERRALGVLEQLGWKKGLRDEEVLHYHAQDHETGKWLLGGGTDEPDRLVEEDGALVLESRGKEAAEKAKKTESLQKVAAAALPVGFFIYAALTVLDVVGIVHSFASHSTTMGWLALLIPPFGAIMGIEALFH